MKLRIILTLLLCCSIAAPHAVQAQIWKKVFGKEEKRRPRPVQKPKEKQPVASDIRKKKTPLEYPPTKIKSRYRIDVLAALYLDELVQDNKAAFKDRVPEKAAPGISFYEGVKLAADTLTALGYSLDVFVHDISQGGSSPEELVKGGVLDETDLIIGAVQSQQVPPLARFAAEKKVNFISAISPSDGSVRENMFFTLLQPRLETHCKRIREAARKQHRGKDILVLYRTNNSVDSAAAAYTMYEADQRLKKVSINTPFNKSQLEGMLRRDSINVVLMPIVDNATAEATLQLLSVTFPNHDFEVYGMPSWKFISSLKKAEPFPKLGIHFTSPFYYDITTTATATLANNHKREFGSRMGEMVFRGYETLYWYAYLLQHYGTVYNPRQADNKTAPFTKFNVKVQWDAQQNILYNENEHLFLYRYQGGSYLINSLP